MIDDDASSQIHLSYKYLFKFVQCLSMTDEQSW